ncbi:MAG: ribonuclease P protein component [Acidobacteria bacterium]|nr:ribonuclease P protein component [Acidobacteriota bacterium]
MKKLQALQNSQQFRKVYEQGQNISTSLFSAFFLKVETGEQRVGITVTRKIGNAVVRNRCKRRLREAIRKQFREFDSPLGFDLVINARSGLVKAEFSSIEAALANAFKRFTDTVSKP